jgi:hypothetical protein
MENGIKALGKINPQTGVVTALPTLLNFDNYVLNSGGAIDPVNLVYYFQTLDSTSQIKMVGLSLLDGSVASESYISSNGSYFIMYRIQSDCYRANRARLNIVTNQKEIKGLQVQVYPNPAQETLHLNAAALPHMTPGTTSQGDKAACTWEHDTRSAALMHTQDSAEQQHHSSHATSTTTTAVAKANRKAAVDFADVVVFPRRDGA